MTKAQLLYPISIVLGCAILGGTYYAVQISRQYYIERQQQLKSDQPSDIDFQKPKMTESQIFEKKVECSKLKLRPGGEAVGSYASEIFYSPKLNTCVYADSTMNQNNVGGTGGWYHLADLLTGDEIQSFGWGGVGWGEANTDTQSRAQQLFELKIEDLKSVK